MSRADELHFAFANILSKSVSARSRPCSVKTTDSLAHGIGNEPLLMQAVEGVPVEALPGPHGRRATQARAGRERHRQSDQRRYRRPSALTSEPVFALNAAENQTGAKSNRPLHSTRPPSAAAPGTTKNRRWWATAFWHAWVRKGYLDALHPSADLATTYSPAS